MRSINLVTLRTTFPGKHFRVWFRFQLTKKLVWDWSQKWYSVHYFLKGLSFDSPIQVWTNVKGLSEFQHVFALLYSSSADHQHPSDQPQPQTHCQTLGCRIHRSRSLPWTLPPASPSQSHGNSVFSKGDSSSNGKWPGSRSVLEVNSACWWLFGGFERRRIIRITPRLLP